MRRPTRRLFTVTLLALAITAAGTVPAVPVSAGATKQDLPPAGLPALRKLFRKQLAPLGVTMSRGLLQDIDTYERSAKGTHLALYVEPSDADYTDSEYVENFTRLTREFIPAVFKRWPGLESFDICQEPPSDPRESPPPVTQIFVSRDALDRVADWRKADLTELIAASPRTRSSSAGYYVYFESAITDDPTLATALRANGWTTTATTTAPTATSRTTGS